MKKLGWLLMLVAIVIGASQGIVMVRHKVAAFGASAPWRQESKNDEKRLLEAFQLQQGLAQLLRSSLDRRSDPELEPTGFQQRLSRIGGVETMAELTPRVEQARRRARETL